MKQQKAVPNEKRRMMKETEIGSINEDLISDILKRLPALNFASAACVCKSWNQICTRILSTPKIASALSTEICPFKALEETVTKVLSQPIRPDFAIASVCNYNIDRQLSPEYLNFLAKKLGSWTPIIVNSVNGVMGRDSITDQFREIMVDDTIGDNINEDHSVVGIILTVGYLPGLKVNAIPLLQEYEELQVPDGFVRDIRNYSFSVSGSTSPMGIVMFAASYTGLQSTIEKLNYAMLKETVIVGDCNTQFIYRSGTESRNVCSNGEYFSDAVALVFARDRNKPFGIGDIQFHSALSNGISAIGPRYKAASVKVNGKNLSIWLTARREGEAEILDGETILDQISDELGNLVELPDLFIGVTRRRKCFVGSEKSRLITMLSFYSVLSDDEDYLYVGGEDIKTGDYFRFYYSHQDTALSSITDVCTQFRDMKLHNDSNREFVGGFIFSCCSRGEPFFGCHDADSSPLLKNFPGIPLAGIFCGGEIARGESIMNVNEGHQKGSGSILMHVYSSVYLLISYTPPQQDH